MRCAVDAKPHVQRRLGCADHKLQTGVVVADTARQPIRCRGHHVGRRGQHERRGSKGVAGERLELGAAMRVASDRCGIPIFVDLELFI